MKELLANQGLYLIVNHISSFLDPRSLARCRLVCHSWRNLIDNDRQWWIFQLEHIHNREKQFIDCSSKQPKVTRSTIKARFPEWNTFMEEVLKRQNIPILKEIVKHMWIYFKNESINYCTNPLYYAVAQSNIVFAQLLIDININ